MNKFKKVLASIVFLITGCSNITPADYAAMEPKLDLREYLNGKLVAHGVLIDYSGKVDRYFRVDMVGKWNGNSGTLDEEFTYNDGKKDKRFWTVEFSDDQNFIGKAGDVIGEARGKQEGNAVNMTYTLRAVRDNGDTIDLSMDDWMYLASDGILINHTKMRKFGIVVGELIISFRKLP